jgi:hypothetical protein
VNPPFSGGGSRLPCAVGPCALSSTQSANAQKARVLAASARFIAHRQDSRDSSPSGGAPIRHQVVPRISRGPAGYNTTLNFRYARRPCRRYTRHNPKCNCQSEFQYSALPATTEVAFTSSGPHLAVKRRNPRRGNREQRCPRFSARTATPRRRVPVPRYAGWESSPPHTRR